MLDDAQFFEVLDVVKNLLLVPPPLELRSKVEERKRQRRAAGCIDSEKVIISTLQNPNEFRSRCYSLALPAMLFSFAIVASVS